MCLKNLNVFHTAFIVDSVFLLMLSLYLCLCVYCMRYFLYSEEINIYKTADAVLFSVCVFVYMAFVCVLMFWLHFTLFFVFFVSTRKNIFDFFMHASSKRWSEYSYNLGWRQSQRCTIFSVLYISAQLLYVKHSPQPTYMKISTIINSSNTSSSNSHIRICSVHITCCMCIRKNKR